MTNEELSKLVVSLTAETIRLKAYCEGLKTGLCCLAMTLGVDPLKIEKAVEMASDEAHQKLLCKIEDVHPATAAALDRRTEPPSTALD